MRSCVVHLQGTILNTYFYVAWLQYPNTNTFLSVTRLHEVNSPTEFLVAWLQEANLKYELPITQLHETNLRCGFWEYTAAGSIISVSYVMEGFGFVRLSGV